jgi:hypothetical protein
MIGVIVGQAFDRAVTIALNKWILFLAAWAVLGAAYLDPDTTSPLLVSIVGLVWYPVAATLAGSALRANFEASSAAVIRLYGAAIAWGVVTIALPALLFAVMIPSYLRARQVGESTVLSSLTLIATLTAGVAYALWMGSRLSLAPTLAIVEHQTVGASFKNSWRLTKIRFWQVLWFNVLITIAQWGLTILPVFLAAAVVGALLRNLDADKLLYIGAHVVPAVCAPLVLYANLASWAGYVRLLDWLETPEAPAVTAASPA